MFLSHFCNINVIKHQIINNKAFNEKNIKTVASATVFLFFKYIIFTE